MRDMISRTERSIRNIPVPASHRRQARAQEEDYEDVIDPPKRKTRRGGRWFLWSSIIVVLVCAGLGVALSTFFAGATVTVSARKATVTTPATLTASLNAPTGSLAFNNITTSRSATISVKTNGTEHVSRPASGTIIIFNAYSKDTQRLIPNTRFEAPDGKIYKIHEAVVVPGVSASGTPGSVSITAYAESPGAEYNRGTTKFTIPGFKGDPRYTKFYALADAMSGGLVGEAPAIAPADLTAAQTSLKQGLSSAMNDAVSAQVPAEYIVIPGTLSISYNDVTQTPASDGSATLAQTATASVSVLRTADLAAAIAKAEVTGYAGEPVDLVDAKTVSVTLASSTSATSNNTLTLKLSGSPTLVWKFDPNALQGALVGKEKSAFEEIVKSFSPAIACTKETPCNASIRPFWSSTFPKEASKIKVNSSQ